MFTCFSNSPEAVAIVYNGIIIIICIHNLIVWARCCDLKLKITMQFYPKSVKNIRLRERFRKDKYLLLTRNCVKIDNKFSKCCIRKTGGSIYTSITSSPSKFSLYKIILMDVVVVHLHCLELFIKNSYTSVVVVRVSGSNTIASDLEYLKNIWIFIPGTSITTNVKISYSCNIFNSDLIFSSRQLNLSKGLNNFLWQLTLTGTRRPIQPALFLNIHFSMKKKCCWRSHISWLFLIHYKLSKKYIYFFNSDFCYYFVVLNHCKSSNWVKYVDCRFFYFDYL